MRSDEISFLVDEALSGRKASAQFRLRRIFEPARGVHLTTPGGHKLVNFASNDYLGLAQNQRVRSAFLAAVERYGVGAGAAPLVSGYGPEQARAEEAIARWKGCERAVLLPSGYQANHAAVQAVAGVCAAAGRKVRFLVDKLCHASIIDAVRGTGEGMRVWPHNGISKLERLLAEEDAGAGVQCVVAESVYSMDGDRADLEGIARLKERFGFVLILDEAHGSGVYGEGGVGLAGEVGLGGLAEITTVTLSKAFGIVGGVLCCREARWADAVVNFGRAYVYSTGVPAAVAAAAVAAIDVMREEPWRQRRVRELASRLREELKGLGCEVLGADDSPIVPVVVGGEGRALGMAERLYERGMLVAAVRPPTVAAGTSRLRMTVSCEHGDEEVGALVGGVRELELRSG